MSNIAKSMEFIRSILKIELSYQNKDISEKEEEAKINKIYYKDAQDFTKSFKKKLEDLEDSEWKSNMLKLFEYMEEDLN